MSIDLISIIITVAVLCLVWWLVTTYIPMPEPIRRVVTVICVLVLIVWLLQFAGLGRVVWTR